MLAGLSPTGSIARAGNAPPDMFDEVLLSSILIHPAGPMFLAGALRPEEADDVTAELVTRSIDVLRKSFRCIVVDLGVAMSDAMLAALDQSQEVVLVAARELSAVKGAAAAIEILRELGFEHDRLVLALNSRSPSSYVDRESVENALQHRVDVEIDFDGSRPEQAALFGEILSLNNPRSEMAKGAEALAAIVAGRHSRRPRP
jgi:pilus assembly protein CpaE